MCFQHKAVMIFERVLGVDHPDTVAAYVSYINVITVFHETFSQKNSLSSLVVILPFTAHFHIF